MESAKDAAFAAVAAVGGLGIMLLASTIAGLVQSAIHP
jgi:hypothetical protein